MTRRTREHARAGRSLAAVAVVALAAVASAALLAPPAHRAMAASKADEKPVKLKKNQAWVAPDYAAARVNAIAIAPVSSFDRNPESEKLVRQAVEPELAALKYRFVGQNTAMDRVRRGGAEKAMEALHAAYLAGAPLDTAQTHAVQVLLGTDALLFGHVSQWQRYVVDPSTRGQSFTQIGVDAAMYSLADGRPLWRGSFQEKGDGPYNDPSVQQTTERDPGGNAVGRKGQLDPPPFEEVLLKLAARVAKAMPPAAAPVEPAPAQ
jgi:hypothetical protein